MLHDFTWENHKNIQNGFDRSIYKRAKEDFWLTLGIASPWHTPSSMYQKMQNAQDKTIDTLKESFLKVETEKLPVWTEQYLVWMKKNDLNKFTKQNIKQFFKEQVIKVSDTTIDKVKKLAQK